MADGPLHEAPAELSPETREMHRALSSLIEELEAVDWYQQRVDATDDDDLARILAHNRDEEKEHACMTLEWIRRRDDVFDRYLRQFLFRSGPIAGAEGDHEARNGDGEAGGNDREPTLGIGSLRRHAGREAGDEEEARP